MFEAGAIDYAYNMQIDIAELEALEALGRARLVAAPPTSVERIMLNFTDPTMRARTASAPASTFRTRS